MGSFGIGHWLAALVIVLIVFGGGRLAQTIGDLARGFRALRKGLREKAASIVDQSTQDGQSTDQNAL